MQQREVEIINKLGLHARASSKLTQLASRFKCEVWISNRKGKRVNAKSIMGVMTLAAAKGTFITIDTSGEDEEPAMAALLELIANRFDESE
jgi:phosphocarrier protein